MMPPPPEKVTTPEVTDGDVGENRTYNDEAIAPVADIGYTAVDPHVLPSADTWKPAGAVAITEPVETGNKPTPFMVNAVDAEEQPINVDAKEILLTDVCKIPDLAVTANTPSVE